MTTKLLLPHKFKLIGWCLLIPAIIIGVILALNNFEADWLNKKVFAVWYDEVFGQPRYFTFITTDLTNTVVGAVFMIGALFVGFSKEKREDEFIAELRFSSLLWAVWVNYLLLLFAFLFVYGAAFLDVMVYNMFTILIIFIVRFNYILYMNSKTASDEK